jgi:Sel1 repeat
MLYATLLERGEEVKQNFKQAVKFYRLAADNNYPAAMHALARCYLHGVGLLQSDEQAFSTFDAIHFSKIPLNALLFLARLHRDLRLLAFKQKSPLDQPLFAHQKISFWRHFQF